MSTEPGPYNPRIPASRPDDLATTQPQFLNNFLQLFNIFANNHVPMNATNAGNHNIIQLSEQLNTIQTGTGEINVYTKDAPDQTDQIFIKYAGPSGPEFQFTNYQIYPLIPTAVQPTQFFTFLPGRILIYFGTCNLKQPKGETVLYLNPAVGINLITANATPSTNVADTFKPTLSWGLTPQGYYNRIGLSNVLSNQSPTAFYFAAVNV